eukprot:555649-Pelagomonas_calceolata.AAC.4
MRKGQLSRQERETVDAIVAARQVQESEHVREGARTKEESMQERDLKSTKEESMDAVAAARKVRGRDGERASKRVYKRGSMRERIIQVRERAREESREHQKRSHGRYLAARQAFKRGSMQESEH